MYFCVYDRNDLTSEREDSRDETKPFPIDSYRCPARSRVRISKIQGLGRVISRFGGGGLCGIEAPLKKKNPTTWLGNGKAMRVLKRVGDRSIAGMLRSRYLFDARALHVPPRKVAGPRTRRKIRRARPFRNGQPRNEVGAYYDVANRESLRFVKQIRIVHRGIVHRGGHDDVWRGLHSIFLRIFSSWI